jgi:hypothetical protein
VSTDGSYCRSFTASGSTQEMAGLACKNGGGWKLPMLLQSPRQPGAARPPMPEPPAAVQAVVEQRSSGALLDAAAEQEAMQKGWLR